MFKPETLNNETSDADSEYSDSSSDSDKPEEEVDLHITASPLVFKFLYMDKFELSGLIKFLKTKNDKIQIEDKTVVQVNQVSYVNL